MPSIKVLEALQQALPKLVSKGYRTSQTVGTVRLTRGVSGTNSFKIKLPKSPHRKSTHFARFCGVETIPRQQGPIDIFVPRAAWDTAENNQKFNELPVFFKYAGHRCEGTFFKRS